MKKFLAACLSAVVVASPVHATPVSATYEGGQTSVGNCYPFGGDGWQPNMGFIYQNIAAFELRVGDIIAFDTGRPNPEGNALELSIATTEVNGGRTATSAGFTTVGSITGHIGDSIVGNYDAAFVSTVDLSFAGGGLIANFSDLSPARDRTCTQTLAGTRNNDVKVARYYRSSNPGVGSTSLGALRFDTGAIGNMRIISSGTAQIGDPAVVPLPAAGWMLLLGLGGFVALARRKRSA